MGFSSFTLWEELMSFGIANCEILQVVREKTKRRKSFSVYEEPIEGR